MELHWLPVRQRIAFKLLLITYKSLNQMDPMYLSELIFMAQAGATTSAAQTVDSFLRILAQNQRKLSLTAPLCLQLQTYGTSCLLKFAQFLL